MNVYATNIEDATNMLKFAEGTSRKVITFYASLIFTSQIGCEVSCVTSAGIITGMWLFDGYDVQYSQLLHLTNAEIALIGGGKTNFPMLSIDLEQVLALSILREISDPAQEL